MKQATAQLLVSAAFNVMSSLGTTISLKALQKACNICCYVASVEYRLNKNNVCRYMGIK